MTCPRLQAYDPQAPHRTRFPWEVAESWLSRAVLFALVLWALCSSAQTVEESRQARDDAREARRELAAERKKAADHLRAVELLRQRELAEIGKAIAERQ